MYPIRCMWPGRLRRYEEITSFVAELNQMSGMVWIPSSWSYAGGASYALYEQVGVARENRR